MVCSCALVVARPDRQLETHWSRCGAGRATRWIVDRGGLAFQLRRLPASSSKTGEVDPGDRLFVAFWGGRSRPSGYARSWGVAGRPPQKRGGGPRPAPLPLPRRRYAAGDPSDYSPSSGRYAGQTQPATPPFQWPCAPDSWWGSARTPLSFRSPFFRYAGKTPILRGMDAPD